MSNNTESKVAVNADATQRGPELPDVLRITDICQHLGISRTQLARVRQQGDFPPPFAVGKHPRWLRNTYLDWIQKGGSYSK